MQGRADSRPSLRPARSQPWLALVLTLSLCTMSACSEEPVSAPNQPEAPAADPIQVLPDEAAGSSDDSADPGARAPSPGEGLSVPTSDDANAALATEEAEDLDALQDLLLDSWTRRDDEIVIAVMGDPFHLALWRSEGTNAPPRDAILQLGNYYPGAAPVVALQPQPDIVDLLDGSDPNTFWGPDVEVLRNIVTSGWAEDGQGQAILVLARHPNGFPYFHGALIAPAGFE